MSETIPGGCYLNSDGKGYHDANGNPVSEENVTKFKALQKQNAERAGQAEAQLAQQNMTTTQLLAALMGMQPTPTLVVEPEDTATGKVTTADTGKVTTADTGEVTTADTGKVDAKAKK